MDKIIIFIHTLPLMDLKDSYGEGTKQGMAFR